VTNSEPTNHNGDTMRRWLETTLLIVCDLLSGILAMGVALAVSELATREGLLYGPEAYILPTALLSIIWVGLLFYGGLYGEWSTRSRMDEILWLAKVLFFGGVILFAITFDPQNPFPPSRIVLLSYGVSLFVFCSGGRLIVRAYQRHLFAKGRGLYTTLIVGVGDRAKQLRSRISRYPRLGYRVEGHVALVDGRQSDTDLPSVGNLDGLPELVRQFDARAVMFADPDLSNEDVLNVVALCDSRRVSFSVVPDMYDVIAGRGSGLGDVYGVPVMPLFPDTMPVWQRRTKRLIDIVLSVTGIIIGLPVWLLIGLAVWLEDRGPMFYSQVRVGLEGRHIRVHKFRSMVQDAEKKSGPTWASKNDDRITRVGRTLRKLRLDEVPQLWNVLVSEMSLVGPRPERPYFVEKLAEEIPLYRFRLHEKPGVTGWAQTKQAYDTSIDDVREKLQYDLYYIENMSLKFDIVILFRTIWVMIAGKGAQ
jgi:exopolysaccharide biosynthesis polyprenyl glycosylphosphotransferase